MTRQDVEVLFAQRRDALQRHDAVAAARFHADDGVVESPVAGGVVQGRAAIQQVYGAFFSAFPDVAFASDELLIDGDRVVEILTIAGTDSGGFLGLPATRKPFRMPIVLSCKVSNGQIVHERRIYDFTGLLVQIGVLKAKPA